EILVDVKVININDNFPQFTRQMYEFFLPEGDYSLHEFLVGRTAASDKDAGTSSCSSSQGQIRYKIVNETGVFSINPITGYLSTSSAFDRESKSNYTIIVEASDMDSLASLSNTSEVVVYVTDVNDNSPVFSQSQYSVNIS
ncbi:Cadherin-19, partial [Exaiptasia diaphana]